ncbi:MAG: DHA2 family efflux MFS transporter permease subunit [Sphingomicrobium sp.]
MTIAEPHVLEPGRRALVTFAVMLAVFMQVLDTTIANVALPHMQAALGATQETVNWVLTSYIVASAIAIPIAGWLADRIGRKRLLVLSAIGFTLASLLCAIATSLPEMVLFRALQGVSGAFLVPLAQATLFDITPKEKHPSAMALFGGGLMIGPILGPVLGGWLTDSFDWRFVFLVNLPVGGLAAAMLWRFMPAIELSRRRFDLFGFGLIAIALGALQMMLDRGQQLDWFESTEIWIELGLTIAAFWMFTVHIVTAREPLFDRAMFRDRNFVTGLLFMMVTGLLMLAGLALLPPLLQQLYGYSVFQSGELTAPRGVGTLISIAIAGKLSQRIDTRLLVGLGMGFMGLSLYLMTGFALVQPARPVIVSGIIQGLGLGILMVTIQSLSFATLTPKFRTAGSSLLNLSRNIGGSIGISVVTSLLVRNIQTAHADIGAHVTDQTLPTNFAPLVEQMGLPAQSALALVNAEVTRQAAFIAYLDDFKLMMWVTIAAIPLVFLLRPAKKGEKQEMVLAD